MLNGFEHVLTKSKQDQYLVQRYIFIAVCLWERGRSHLVPRLDGQNMIPRSPEERDSQRFGGKRIEDWQAEAAVLNDFQVKRKETKVSLFLVLPP